MFLTFPFWGKNFGYETEEEKQLFKSMVARHSNYYIRWATKQLAFWQEKEGLTAEIIHLHGEEDKVFPIELIQSPKITMPGSHIMVFNRPEGITPYLSK